MGAAREFSDIVDVGVGVGEIEGGREDGELPPGQGAAESYPVREAVAGASPIKEKGVFKPNDVDATLAAEPNRTSRRAGTSKLTGDQAGTTDSKVAASHDVAYERLDQSKQATSHRKDLVKTKEPAKNKGTWENNGERDFRAVLRRESAGRHLQLEAQVSAWLWSHGSSRRNELFLRKISCPTRSRSLCSTLRRNPASDLPRCPVTVLVAICWMSCRIGNLRYAFYWHHLCTSVADSDHRLCLQLNECKGLSAEAGGNVLTQQLALLCKLFDEYVDKRLTRSGQTVGTSQHLAK